MPQLRSSFAALLIAMPLSAHGHQYGDIPNQPSPRHQYGPAPQQVVASPIYGRVESIQTRELIGVMQILEGRATPAFGAGGGLLQRQGEAPARQLPERQASPRIESLGNHPSPSAESPTRLDREITRIENKVKETDRRLAEIERTIQDRTGGQTANDRREVIGDSRRNNVQENHARDIDNVKRKLKTLGISGAAGERQLAKETRKLEKTRDAKLAAIDKDVVKANKLLDKLRNEREQLQTKQKKRQEKIEKKRTAARTEQAKKLKKA